MTTKTTISLYPDIVNIEGYAGDTITLHVIISDPLYADGCTWDAEVRGTRENANIDTEWHFSLDGTGGSYMSLTSEQTAALATVGSPNSLRSTNRKITKVERYTGEYDVQINRPGFVKTLFQGGLILYTDVTRSPVVVTRHIRVSMARAS